MSHVDPVQGRFHVLSQVGDPLNLQRVDVCLKQELGAASEVKSEGQRIVR